MTEERTLSVVRLGSGLCNKAVSTEKPRGASALQIRRRHSIRAAGRRRSPKTRQMTCQSFSHHLFTSVSFSLARTSLTSKHLFMSEQIGWALDPCLAPEK